MKHVPHVIVGTPWDDVELSLSVVQWRHLTRVLRMKRGKPVTYTDGFGRFGEGTLSDHSIRRGSEREIPRGVELTVAVAPPSNKDRQRYLVEKLAELGVSRLQWLTTAHGSGRIASPGKVFSWVSAALEQSQGAWLMETTPGLVKWDDLAEPTNDIDLELGKTGRRHPDARVPVDRVGDEIGYGRMKQTPAGDVGQITRASRVEGLGHESVEQELEKLIEGCTGLGRSLDQGSGKLLATPVIGGRLAGQRLDVLHDSLHSLLDQTAHGVSRQLERE